jgi:hypothetical protein
MCGWPALVRAIGEVGSCQRFSTLSGATARGIAFSSTAKLAW